MNFRVFLIHDESPINLSNLLDVRAIPAAHPKITFDRKGNPNEIGWIFTYKRKKIYAAGDTSVCREIINILEEHKPIDTALLPVNEDNYFRRRRGIIGNMSIREAFQLADELEIKNVIPMHWDLFEANSTSIEEINAVYKNYNWKFNLVIDIEDLKI